MKTSKIILLILMIILSLPTEGFSQCGMGFFKSSHSNDGIKSPSYAAIVSLNPFPIAAGQFYTGNWRRGLLYSTAEVAILTADIVLIADYSQNEWSNWTNNEKNTVIGLSVGYLLVKLISAVDAGNSAEEYNRKLGKTDTSLNITPSGDVMFSYGINF